MLEALPDGIVCSRVRARHLKTDKMFVVLSLQKDEHELNIKLFIDWLNAVLRLTKVQGVLSLVDVIETDSTITCIFPQLDGVPLEEILLTLGENEHAKLKLALCVLD